MMHLVKYSPAHIREMDIVNEPWTERSDIYASYGLSGPAYTSFDDGKPVFSAGVAIPWKGFGEAWMLMSKDAHKYPLSVYRHVRNMLNAIIEDNNLHRVQATIADGQPYLVKWIERLGFKREGLLRKFGPDGSDFILYARVRE